MIRTLGDSGLLSLAISTKTFCKGVIML